MVSALKSPTASKTQQAGVDFAQDDFGLKKTPYLLISNFRIQAQGMPRITWRIPNECYLKILKKIKNQPKLLFRELLRQFIEIATNCSVTKSPKWAVTDAADWYYSSECIKGFLLATAKAAWAI